MFGAPSTTVIVLVVIQLVVLSALLAAEAIVGVLVTYLLGGKSNPR